MANALLSVDLETEEHNRVRPVRPQPVCGARFLAGGLSCAVLVVILLFKKQVLPPNHVTKFLGVPGHLSPRPARVAFMPDQQVQALSPRMQLDRLSVQLGPQASSSLQSPSMLPPSHSSLEASPSPLAPLMAVPPKARVRTGRPSMMKPVVIPPRLLPGAFAASRFRWIFESFAGFGSFTMGLPGIVSMGIFLSPISVMMRIFREGSVGKLPLLPYSAMASQGFVWTFYGLVGRNPAIWTPNLLAAILGLAYTMIFCRHCPADAEWLPATRGIHFIGIVVTFALCCAAVALLPCARALLVLGYMGNVLTLAMFGGPLAAIRTVVREKNTRSLPVGFTVAVLANCTLWFSYAYGFLADRFIYMQDGIGLTLALIQVSLFCRFGIHK